MTKITHLHSRAFRAMLVALLATAAFPGTAQQAPDASKGIFPKGEQGPAQNFTGKAWNYGLVPADSTFTTLVGNVYFEPGARTNWHTHPAGQILIITDGAGYHQIEGGPRESLKKGDVVKCPPVCCIGTARARTPACSSSTLCRIPKRALCSGNSL
ncbi:MAG: cupin domain-containing protein [Dyadobacter fermentans]